MTPVCPYPARCAFLPHRHNTMQLQTLPLAHALGHILAHNLADAEGRKVLAKGRRLTEADLPALGAVGYTQVEVAVLGANDVHEDEAAERIASALVEGSRGAPLRATRGAGGRVNLHTETDGVLYVDAARLLALNTLPGVTLATRPAYTLLGPGFQTTQAATLKIIPYALPETTVAAAEAGTAGVLHIAPLRPQRVALLLTAEPGAAPRLLRQWEGATGARLEPLGSTLGAVATVPLEEEAILKAAAHLLSTHDALVIAGQTSIMDEGDITPRALLRLGAEGLLHGAPVEPGNLLALAFLGAQWILCAPGCARSPAQNVVDLILPRLLTGERLGRAEIGALGMGGLL